MRKAFGWAAFLLAIATSAAGCSGDGATVTGDACAAGQQIECACGGGAKGFQVCLADGSGYGACQSCGDASGGGGTGGAAGADGSAGGSGGASGGGGSSGAGGSGGAGGAGGSSGAAGGGPSDAAWDGPTTCAPGTASTVTSGSCDLALQDCSGGLTCGIAKDDGGAWQTECLTLGQGTQTLGQACASHSECSPGLRCSAYKCTRPCCSEAEGYLCGPGGRCDLQIGFGGGTTLYVCTFPVACDPWSSNCPATEPDCHIGNGSDFTCTLRNFDADAGGTEGASCTYINDCESSQHCIYSGADASAGTCRWLCKASDTGAPDSGTVGGAPGQGGCPSGQTCHAYGTPSWLGYCSP